MDVRTDTDAETVCNPLSADRHAHIACKTHCNLRDRETREQNQHGRDQFEYHVGGHVIRSGG